MRTFPLIVVVSILSFVAIDDADAIRVSRESAKSFCKGKTATKDGGCAWCGRQTCTTVTCGEGQTDCDVITVRTGPPKKE
jgi:hypothetical protein